MGAGASATSMTSQNGLFEKQKLKAAKKKAKKSSTPVVPLAEDAGCKGGRKTQTETGMTRISKVKEVESDVEPLHV